MQSNSENLFDVVGIAASAGGLKPVTEIISGLPSDFPASLLVVMHRSPDSPSMLRDILRRHTAMEVREAKDGEKLSKSTIYLARSDRHLEMNPDWTISLGSAERVHFVRPAADVLFITMAISCKKRAIAIILSGAGQDGTIGSLAVKRAGGTTIVQKDPQFSDMPQSAVEVDDVDFVVDSAEIAPLLIELVTKGRSP